MTPPIPRQIEFLEAFGFDTDPFQFTNADDEPLLSEYFVAPPYFDSVYGDPRHPASCMVFAPRGAGKSAQRRMVESYAPEETILSITYDSFRNPSRQHLLEMRVADHLTNVARIGVVGLITWIGQNRDRVQLLTGGERAALRSLALGLLYTVTQAELRDALNALRNLSTTAKELWNEHRWALSAVLSSINIAAGGAGGGPLPPAEVEEDTEQEPSSAIDLIGRLATKLGLDAIYILIDRVDETQETAANQEAAYRLMSPLMHELRLLEQYPFAYKFFLPDYILPFYRAHGGRSDRIRSYEASWTNDELGEMMEKRLAAYSQQRVKSLPYLISPGENPAPLIRLSLLFAHRSPRDLVRIWGRVVDEQLRLDASATAISADAVFSGIDTFCFERAQEIATEGAIRDLRRVAKVDFTVSEVASDVFHVERNSARARIQGWDNRGIVKQIGEVPAPRGRPHHLYGIVDIRVARAALPDIRLDQFVAAKARICPNCESWVLRDFDDFTGEREEPCVECGIPLVAV